VCGADEGGVVGETGGDVGGTINGRPGSAGAGMVAPAGVPAGGGAAIGSTTAGSVTAGFTTTGLSVAPCTAVPAGDSLGGRSEQPTRCNVNSPSSEGVKRLSEPAVRRGTVLEGDLATG
jgi:hypothetical protein